MPSSSLSSSSSSTESSLTLEKVFEEIDRQRTLAKTKGKVLFLKMVKRHSAKPSCDFAAVMSSLKNPVMCMHGTSCSGASSGGCVRIHDVTSINSMSETEFKETLAKIRHRKRLVTPKAVPSQSSSTAVSSLTAHQKLKSVRSDRRNDSAVVVALPKPAIIVPRKSVAASNPVSSPASSSSSTHSSRPLAASSQSAVDVSSAVNCNTQPVARLSKKARRKLTNKTTDVIADALAQSDMRSLSAEASSLIRAQISLVIDQVVAKFDRSSSTPNSHASKPAAVPAQTKRAAGVTHDQPVLGSVTVLPKKSPTIARQVASSSSTPISHAPKPAAAPARKKRAAGVTHDQPVLGSVTVFSKESPTTAHVQATAHSSHTDGLTQTVNRLESELCLIRQSMAMGYPPVGHYIPYGSCNSGIMMPPMPAFPRLH